MKWKQPATPTLGDEKTEIRFAFFPTNMSDGYTVWLETYRVHLRYEARMIVTKFAIVVRREDWFEVKTETLW